jgi:hypothetical protein
MPSPEDGNAPSFENVVFFRILTMDEVKKSSNPKRLMLVNSLETLVVKRKARV